MSIESIRKQLSVKGAAPLVGVALLFGTVACTDSEGPNEGTTLEDVQDDGDVTEEDIAQAPNEAESDDFFQEGDTEGFFEDRETFIDEPVTVSGKIVEVLNPNAFVIGEGELATLVTRETSDNMLTLQPGEIAQVTGPVGNFVLVDVESELSTDFEDEDFNPFESGPYIAAENVNLLDSES